MSYPLDSILIPMGAKDIKDESKLENLWDSTEYAAEEKYDGVRKQMRKVRVWDDVLKEMLYSRVEQFDDMLGFRFEKHLETENPIYMWSTDLPDKNGREIYEGDIISTDLDRPFNIVVFRNGAFMFQCHDNGKDYYDYMFSADEESDRWQFGEIIGNVWENPELLKGEETT